MNNNLTEFQQFSNRDYLTWDAPSMRNLLIRKLNESGIYTDQIFPGSDLAVMIDLAAYSFAMMTYISNNNAAEATFADTQFYENMNRLVKFLSYNPKGFTSSVVGCQFAIDQAALAAANPALSTSQTYIEAIPRYATYRMPKSDIQGRTVCYTLAGGEGNTIQDEQSFVFMLDGISGQYSVSLDTYPNFYNGFWKLYPTQFVATGIQRESFILSAIDSTNKDTPEIVAHPFVDVYVYDKTTNIYTKFQSVSNLYDYGPTDRVYVARLNENYQYELTFGDGINGSKLNKGQVLYVIYMVTNGSDGKIAANELDGSVVLEVSVEGLTADQIKDICFGGSNQFNYTYGLFHQSDSGVITSPGLSVSNSSGSSEVADFEAVDSIKQNAPNAFRSGRRLVTIPEYEQFVKDNYSNTIRSVKGMDNFEYAAEFQAYLLKYGLLNVNVRQYGYRYADACDFNNIYLWMRSINGGFLSEFTKQTILGNIKRAKSATGEIVPMDTLAMLFIPYLSAGTGAAPYAFTDWDPNFENQIIITKDYNSIVNNERVKESVIDAIIKFFSPENQTIGALINVNQLYTNLMAIDGVKKIQTGWVPTGRSSEWVYVDGLSFAYWTPVIFNGVDFQSGTNGLVKLKNFHFPELYRSTDLKSIVTVVSDNHYITSPGI